MGRLLVPEDFIYCRGPVISGHVHKSGCFSGFYYYCGCPYRWKFGEEEDKGFLLLIHDLDTQIHYVEFEKMVSDIYATIFLDDLETEDPQKIIAWIDQQKRDRGIDYIKVKIRRPISGANRTVISQYYRNINDTFVEFPTEKEIQKQKAEEMISSNGYNYLMDDKLSDLEKFVMYVNNNENEQFITVEKLKEILKSDI
jgi:DNA repair exonuclease SbcCD nuclease subunit